MSIAGFSLRGYSEMSDELDLGFLGDVVYGLESPGDGAVELVRGWVRSEKDIPGYQIPRITGGLLREESKRLFAEYVARREPGPMRDWAQTLSTLCSSSPL